MRVLIRALLAIAVVAPVFATGSGEADSAGPAEVRFAWWGNAARHEKHDAIIDVFERANPGIDIVGEPASWGDYWTKLATQASAGNPPDVMTMHLNESERFARNGVFAPLQPFVDEGVIDLSDWTENMIRTGYDLGTLYRLTEGENTHSIWVNTGMVDRFGLDSPNHEMSWDAWQAYFIENQSKLPEGVWMTKDVSIGYSAAFLVWLRQAEGVNSLVNDTDTGLGFEPETLASYLEYWQELREAGAVVPPEIWAEFDGLPREENAVVTETIVVEWMSANQIVPTQDLMDSQLRLHRLPTMPSGVNTYGNFTQGAYLAIASSSDYPESAARFVNFFLNDWEAQSIFGAEHGRVGNEMIAKQLEGEVTPLQLTFFDLTSEVIETAPPRDVSSRYQNQITSAVTRAGEQVAFGVKSIDEAVAELFESAAAIFE